MPIIAILGAGQTSTPTLAGPVTVGRAQETAESSSWTSPQNLAANAQVTVLERFRYISG